MIINELKKLTTYTIFCDMDGVIVDMYSNLKRHIDKDYSDEKYENNSQYRKEIWDKVKQYEQQGGEFWFELKPLDNLKLWNYIKPHNPQILSSTGGTIPGVGEQKRRWVKKYLDEDTKVNLVNTAEKKKEYAKPSYILIDDKRRAIDPWIKAGGIGILHISAENTIEQLKKLGV